MGRKVRIKKKTDRLRGSVPRLVVYRSNKYLYAQIVDDIKGLTLVQANTKEKEVSGGGKSRKNLEFAKSLGNTLGKRALEKKIDAVLFDRNGYKYHGRVKAIADAAREAGLKF
jgi:large subunit ribosomal protein L18